MLKITVTFTDGTTREIDDFSREVLHAVGCHFATGVRNMIGDKRDPDIKSILIEKEDA